MASVKIVLRTTMTKKNGEHPIFLRLVKNRKAKFFYLGHTSKGDEKSWDSATNRPKNNDRLKAVINLKESDAENIVLDFEREKKDFTFEDFSRKFVSDSQNITVYKYFTEVINRLEKSNKIGNASVYKDSKNAVFQFYTNQNLAFSDINYKFLKTFEEHLLAKGNKPNGIFVYMRTIRALINSAIKEGYCKSDYYPFKNQFINPNGYDPSKLNKPTNKKALTEEQLKQIISFEIPESSTLYDAKNIFAFSFYTMGMNFTDIALLKWSNVKGDRIEYLRAKTGKNYSIKLLEPAIAIINYYKAFKRNTERIFPILNENHITPKQINTRIKKVLKKTNSDLRDLVKDAGLEINDYRITTYVARHSWATILKRKGVSTSIISEGLGHQTEKTTQVYLDSFEKVDLDNANEKILEGLNK